jgi:hypothetical protein
VFQEGKKGNGKMPANIAHLLICNKAVKALQNGDEYEEFINILDSDECKPYLNLGSIGPDLSYYGSQWEGLKGLILDQGDKPLGVDGWSYLLHSREPNRFPLTLVELTWKDTRWEQEEWEQIDHYKFAFTCGFLSHMAADQIIHPKVNDIAGPYYRSAENRKIHRECEIYQDVALFHELYPQEDFMEKSFNLWVDIAPKSGHNAPDWFRYFIQRAFVESHGVYPEEDEVEDWIDGLLLILRGLKHVGPYRRAYQEFKTQGPNSEKFRCYFRGYMDLFFKSIELTSIYWRALFELYDTPEGTIQITETMRTRFRSIVQNADLSSPLQRDILGDAKKALYHQVPRQFEDLVRKTSAPLDRERILHVVLDDAGKFSEA